MKIKIQKFCGKTFFIILGLLHNTNHDQYLHSPMYEYELNNHFLVLLKNSLILNIFNLISYEVRMNLFSNFSLKKRYFFYI